MSSGVPEARRPVQVPEWDHLEPLVRRLLQEYELWQARAVAAESRVQHLEVMLREAGSGRLDPRQLNAELEEIRAENRELRRRLRDAHASVARMITRVELLSEGR